MPRRGRPETRAPKVPLGDKEVMSACSIEFIREEVEEPNLNP